MKLELQRRDILDLPSHFHDIVDLGEDDNVMMIGVAWTTTDGFVQRVDGSWDHGLRIVEVMQPRALGDPAPVPARACDTFPPTVPALASSVHTDPPFSSRACWHLLPTGPRVSLAPPSRAALPGVVGAPLLILRDLL